MTVEEYFGDWSKVIDLREADRIIKKLSVTKNICPLVKDIFKAFRLCPLSSLRLVVIGYDPYPDIYKGKPRATGIAFANAADTPDKELSPSLDKLKESFIDFTVPHKTLNFDPSLEKLEAQGVLLLNTALSCEVGKIGSHTLLWRPFITTLLTNLSNNTTGIVYVLMGSVAQSLEPYINKELNYVIHIKHPSYYARTNTRMPSDVWKKVNNILIGLNGKGVQWYEET